MLRGTFLRIGEPPLRLAGATSVAVEATPLRCDLAAPTPSRSVSSCVVVLALLPPPPPAPPLSSAQHAQFARDGFLIIRGVVPPLALEAARRQAFAHLHMAACCADASRYGTDHPALLGLFSATRLRADADALLGGCSVAVGGAQLSAVPPAPLPAHLAAEAFAAAPDASDCHLAVLSERRPAHAATRWHVDGMDESRSVLGFSLLAIVALTDTVLPAGGDGGLVVFPGSHAEVGRLLARMGVAALCDTRPRPALVSAAPVQLRLAAGDVALLHPLLAHTRGANYEACVRLAAVFRMQRSDHEAWRAAQLEAVDAT